ncbi:spore germination protein KA [Paenibacillus catalpae]|uniref:Spore germination protein KA n=1 Tax=Paenibacillus catalpae TaxID=1045775 RepID=A0A1I2BSL8_9BACL|nr:spore germination protein [Paenibacillus catalpae]SFE59064.1 spore germination protein KA [Paenibacillus catalpae]
MLDNDAPEQREKHLDVSLIDNIATIKNKLGDSDDIIVKKFKCMQNWPAATIYIDGLVDSQLLHNSILQSLQLKLETGIHDSSDYYDRIEYIQQNTLATNTDTFCTFKELYDHLLSGHVILLLDNETKGLWIDVSGLKERSVGEPQSHTVVRGPMEGFTENLRTNTALIRRRIRDPRLWIESRKIGNVTHTSVAFLYIKGIADEGIIDDLRKRLDQIEIDGILESGYIEELIQDKIKTPFPTVYNTERPDTIAAGLLEGRIAIVVDGTPFVLLIPALFVQFFQSPEDYYQRADISTLVRLLRYLSFFIALLAPAMYIAISTFHLEMLPTNLIISIAAQREGVPFPAFIEAILMEITYEILREAGVRIPRTIGQAVSIVGTLVIGQAAVAAGVVSAAMVIIVSITAISSYVIPENGLSIAIRMLRFCMMFLAASFGLFGIWIGLMAILFHLTTLKSFGVPYMSPFGPYIAPDIKDSIFRIPWKRMKTLPLYNPNMDKLGGRGSKRLKVGRSSRRRRT